MKERMEIFNASNKYGLNIAVQFQNKLAVTQDLPITVNKDTENKFQNTYVPYMNHL